MCTTVHVHVNHVKKYSTHIHYEHYYMCVHTYICTMHIYACIYMKPNKVNYTKKENQQARDVHEK